MLKIYQVVEWHVKLIILTPWHQNQVLSAMFVKLGI